MGLTTHCSLKARGSDAQAFAHDWLKRPTMAFLVLEECGCKLTSGQLVDLGVTGKVHEGFRRCYSSLSPAPLSNDFVGVHARYLPHPG